MTAALYLILQWALRSGLFRVLGGKLELRQYACSLGTAFIPVIAAAHPIEVLLKTA